MNIISIFVVNKPDTKQIMEPAAVNKNNHGANVKRWREWRDVSQEALAKKLGVTQAIFSDYEKKDKLEPEVLVKIAKALDIPVEAITELKEGSAINIFSGTFNDNAVVGGPYFQPTFNPLDKVVELYEKLLNAEKEKLAMLQEIIKNKNR